MFKLVVDHGRRDNNKEEEWKIHGVFGGRRYKNEDRDGFERDGESRL